MEPSSNTSFTNPRDLIRLDFSPPQYHSVAHYTNENGQEFLIWVSGSDKDAIQHYINELRLSLEIVPLQQQPRNKQADRPPDGSYSAADGKETDHIPSPRDLIVSIQVTVAPGLDPPFILRGTIDPSIDNNAVQDYPFVESEWANVEVDGARNTVTAELYQAGTSRLIPRVIGAGGTATLSHDVGDRSPNFCIRIIGNQNDSGYALQFDVEKRRFDQYVPTTPCR